MQPIHTIQALLLGLFMALILTGTANAQVPVRISIKYILNASDNRPALGNLATDEQIDAEVTAGINILAGVISEFSIDQIEFVDLTGLSKWYLTTATEANRDALRTAAQADPATYHWRTDAINIYITAGDSSAVSDFPPNNNIILMNQNCGNNPSCILHEMGHSMNLYHTHSASENCADILPDNKDWTKDQLAQNSYSCLYANCTAAQKARIDLTYNNIMSYHTDEPQTRISACQMDRMSTQGDSDRNWLLSKLPIYVNGSVSPLFTIGRFVLPYTSLQTALSAGGLANKVLVLQQGDYTVTQDTISDTVEIVTRSGPSDITNPGFQAYKLPVDLENSKNPNVRKAIKGSQDEDMSERKVRRDAQKAEKAASKEEEKNVIRADAHKKRKVHRDNALKNLIDAEQYAEGNEKIAIQKQIAMRYRDAGDCAKAIPYFRKVADTTDQPLLKQEVLGQIERCGKALPPEGVLKK